MILAICIISGVEAARDSMKTWRLKTNPKNPSHQSRSRGGVQGERKAGEPYARGRDGHLQPEEALGHDDTKNS